MSRLRHNLHWLLAMLSLGASLFGWSAPAAHAIQQAENDDAFDLGGYNNVAEDTLVTKPLDDFFPPITWNMQFNFNVSQGGGFNGQPKVNTSLTQIFNTNYTEQEQFQKQSSQNPVPRSNIKLSSSIVQPGAEITAIAQAENFLTGDGKDLFYAWAINNVSANGLAASGSTDLHDLPTASAPNTRHTRKPTVDKDRDGMDDNWELRFGLNPNDPSDAFQNPDGDGYVNDVYKNKNGEILKVTPPTAAGFDFGGTNLEEYIFGTNPLIADTDGDGFTDGQDLAGLGQIKLNFTIPDSVKAGDILEIRLTTLGKAFQQFDRETDLVKVDSSVVQVKIGDSEQVQAALSASNLTPIPGEKVTLTTTLGDTAYHPGLLTYSWFINGQFIVDASGESRSTFEYVVPTDAKPDDIITVGVRAENFQTGQESEASLDLRVADVLQLMYDPTAVVPGKPYTVSATLLSGTVDPADLVFHWTKNGQPITDQSGLGKTTFTETTDGSPGDEFDLGLRVTTPDDSKLFGEVKAVVDVQQPAVDIVTPDSFIEPGQTVELTAVPAHFKSDQLEFRWTIDGQVQTLPLDTRTVDVQGTAVNAVITVTVQVRTVGDNPESASAVEYETVVAATTTALTSPPASPRAAVAALIGVVGSHPWATGLGVLGATGVASLAIVARKRRTHA